MDDFGGLGDDVLQRHRRLPASLDKPLIAGLLRQTGGFNGYVVSDRDAVQPSAARMARTMSEMRVAAQALPAGVDLNCGNKYRLLTGAFEAHFITVSDIDRSVPRLPFARLSLEIIGDDAGPHAHIPAWVLDSPEHRALARRAALESIVLLKNTRVLPLDTTRMKLIALLGPLAADLNALIGDYAGEPSSLYHHCGGTQGASGALRIAGAYYPPDQPSDGYGDAALGRIARGGVPIENRRLLGLARVSVPCSGSRRVTVPLGWWALSSVDATGQRAVRSGRFEISIGGGQPGGAAAAIAASLDLASGFEGRRLTNSDYVSGAARVDVAAP